LKIFVQKQIKKFKVLRHTQFVEVENRVKIMKKCCYLITYQPTDLILIFLVVFPTRARPPTTSDTRGCDLRQTGPSLGLQSRGIDKSVPGVVIRKLLTSFWFIPSGKALWP
jgi:hypothetical protein